MICADKWDVPAVQGWTVTWECLKDPDPSEESPA